MSKAKKELENSLARALQAQTPNVLPRVLLCLDEKEGLDEVMDNGAVIRLPVGNGQAEGKKTGRRPALRWVAGIAAALVLLAGLFAGYTGYSFYKTDAVVSFDVNPSIQLRINSAERVLQAQALNAEAEEILAGMDLKNVDLNVAVNALVGSMLKNGYISEARNTILISVENSSAARGEELQQRLAGEVDGILATAAVQGAVISQTVGEDDSLRQLAEQYGISQGKAALVQLLVNQDPLLSFDEVAQLSVNDIYLLIAAKQAPLGQLTTSGQASNSAYIGEAAAKAAAFAHAGVAEGDVTALKVELDYDDGRMTYEVEFDAKGAEYEYEIDAVNGTVLKYEQEPGRQGAAGSWPGQPQNLIGEEAAKNAALAHAGLQAQDVTFVNTALYQKQGVWRYDLVFLDAGNKYNCEVDATTGAVLAYHAKARDGQGSGPQGQFIGEEAAKAAALAHAGLDAQDVRGLKAELDEEDGRWIYEVEFKQGGTEYDYDIDAVSGAVLYWDADVDD